MATADAGLPVPVSGAALRGGRAGALHRPGSAPFCSRPLAGTTPVPPNTPPRGPSCARLPARSDPGRAGGGPRASAGPRGPQHRAPSPRPPQVNSRRHMKPSVAFIRCVKTGRQPAGTSPTHQGAHARTSSPRGSSGGRTGTGLTRQAARAQGPGLGERTLRAGAAGGRRAWARERGHRGARLRRSGHSAHPRARAGRRQTGREPQGPWSRVDRRAPDPSHAPRWPPDPGRESTPSSHVRKTDAMIPIISFFVERKTAVRLRHVK